MKKVVFLFILFVLLSCSSSEEGSSNSDFNPPAWIQGTWRQEGSTAGTGVGFKFSTNDLCTLIYTAEQCQQGMIYEMRKSGQTATVDETISNTSYSAKINYYGGQSVTYSFIKISNTEIEWSGSPRAVFIKQ